MYHTFQHLPAIGSYKAPSMDMSVIVTAVQNSEPRITETKTAVLRTSANGLASVTVLCTVRTVL